MRSKVTDQLETSTHRVKDLTIDEIWKLGYEYVEDVAQGRIIKARGQGAYALAAAQGLSLDVNGSPFPRHVDLIGWSPDKEDRLMKATEIANNMTLEIDPRGIM
jgi:hypothetical protein